MKTQLIKLVLLWTLCILMASCTSLPRIYSGESIHGWVLDSKTKEPIKDVVVVEVWELEGGWHTDHTANIQIAETLTDKEGYYSFPEWGPTFTTDGTVSGSSPRLVFYKFGYEDIRLSNAISGNPNRDYRISEHSGEKIELVKFVGEEKLYAKKISSIHGALQLNSYRKPLKCTWKKIPIYTSEIIKAERYFRHKNIYSSLPSLGYYSAPECQNPEVILKDYLK